MLCLIIILIVVYCLYHYAEQKDINNNNSKNIILEDNTKCNCDYYGGDKLARKINNFNDNSKYFFDPHKDRISRFYNQKDYYQSGEDLRNILGTVQTYNDYPRDEELRFKGQKPLII